MSEQEQPKPANVDDEREDTDQEVADREQSQTQQIIETGAITTTKGKHVIHCLTIVGQVEGHYILPPQNKTTKYEHVIPQLMAIQESPDIKGLIIILNTVGGDVEAGLAIAELVSGMRKPTVSLVLGGGHSIGVPLAVSANRSFIVPSATMTIHPVRMNGVVLGVPQTLSYFDKMQERIVRFVEDNSNISGEKFRELMMKTGELVMDVGTVLDGQQAVEAGLIDNLGGLSDAIDCLGRLIEEQSGETQPEEGERADRQRVIPRLQQMPASPRAIAQLRMNSVQRRGQRRRYAAAKVESPHIGAEARHTLNRRDRAAGIESGSGMSCGGGGDENRVNPFGHAAPPASATE